MADLLLIQETSKTPRIEGVVSTGKFHMRGRCLPEDVMEFYYPVQKWLMEFYKTPSENVHAIIELDYFNTSFSLHLKEFFKELQMLSVVKNVRVEWRYEADDFEMEQSGLAFKELFNSIIELVQVNPI